MAAPTWQSVAVADSSGDVSTLSVNKPAGTADGDLLVARASIQNTRSFTSEPAGWTLVDEEVNATTAIKQRIYAKNASSEPASYSWDIDVARNISLEIHRITGHYAASPIDTFNVTADTAAPDTTQLCNGVTPNRNDGLMLLLGAGQSAAARIFTPHASMTERSDHPSGALDSSGLCLLAHSATEAAPAAGVASGSRDYTSSGNCRTMNHLIVIASLPPSGSKLFFVNNQ